MSAVCPDCRFWRPMNMKGGSDLDLGHCVARAPRVFQNQDGKLRSVWPIVNEKDFCGRHLPAREES